jgi:hypothetical protein
MDMALRLELLGKSNVICHKSCLCHICSSWCYSTKYRGTQVLALAPVTSNQIFIIQNPESGVSDPSTSTRYNQKLG